MSMATVGTFDTSVIICAYTEDRWLDLVAAVQSIQRQSTPPGEVIVVIDNNQELLERARTTIPDVIVVENRNKQGLSGARNSGIAMAQGALIAFLDDDATAEPDWLERLARCCEDPKVLGAGGRVEPHWLGKRPPWFPDEFFWVVGCSYLSPPVAPEAVRNPYGGCTCIRREVFEVIGGFRSDIGRVGVRPAGGEETELSIRARQYWPERVFLCEPGARIQHRIPPDRASWRYFRRRCFAEGQSKAAVARYVGVKDSLASERAYVLQIVPRGVVQGVVDGLFRFDLAGFLRAGAIVAGLMFTTSGYVTGTVARTVILCESALLNAFHNLKQTLHHTERDSNIYEDRSDQSAECSSTGYLRDEGSAAR